MSRSFCVTKRAFAESHCQSLNVYQRIWLICIGDMDFYVFPCGPPHLLSRKSPFPPLQNPKNPLLNQIPIISHNTGHATLVSLNSLSRCPTPNGLRADEGQPMLSRNKILADESWPKICGREPGVPDRLTVHLYGWEFAIAKANADKRKS